MSRTILLCLILLHLMIFQPAFAQEDEEPIDPPQKVKKEKKEKKHEENPKTEEKQPKKSKKSRNIPQDSTKVSEEDAPFIQIELKHYLKEPGITLKSKQVLDELLKILPAYSDLYIRVEGHTGGYNFVEDREEGLEEGQDRSQKQAEQIRDYLINKGFNAELIIAEGFGSSKPKIVGYVKKDKPIYLENDTRFAQMSNERIDLKIELQYTKDFEALSQELQKKNIVFKVIPKK